MESLYRGHRFPPEIIGYAVWLCHRFTLSLRDVEDLLAERGINVSYRRFATGAASSAPPLLGLCDGKGADLAMSGLWTKFSSRSADSSTIFGGLWIRMAMF